MGTNKDTENLGKSIAEIFDRQYKYVIPLYQRNFSWRRPQIEQLLQDIYSAFKNGQNHYYIGSLVVLKRSNGDFEVIDGQQRLTVLSLITKIMKINDEPRLFYDSRPEFEEFLVDFYKSKEGNSDIDYPQTAHLRNAIGYIKEIDLDAENSSTKIGDAGVDFANYFKNNVILVRVEIPQDTDVASYFEIMNNRGAQLQKHEILKSFLLSKLKGKSYDEFAKIWTACSQMDTPIQKLFTADDRRRYFGDNYDDFRFESLVSVDNNLSGYKADATPLDQILEIALQTSPAKNDKNSNGTEGDAEADGDETKYKSIIDFPNFLMHVFKVMFPDKVKFSDGEEKEIPLNEKYLISTYKAVENQLDSEDFIKTLFFCRTIFDKYVVKTVIDEKAEEGERWTLRKPKKNDNNALDFGKTFDNDENQNRIVKALTMLQVSFRSRIYKHWLFEILKWFNGKKDINIGYDAYLDHLDSIILDNYKEREIKYSPIDENIHLTKENSYSEGLNTPHFLFNFIDYLYWVDSKGNKIIDGSKKIQNFDFKYWNSVEHHLAQKYAIDTENNPDDFINNLGNLCLISKSSNSRLSDRSVHEKVIRTPDSNMGANRQVMYAESRDSDNQYSWDKAKIKMHYNELLRLLQNGEEILRNSFPNPTNS